MGILKRGRFHGVSGVLSGGVYLSPFLDRSWNQGGRYCGDKLRRNMGRPKAKSLVFNVWHGCGVVFSGVFFFFFSRSCPCLFLLFSFDRDAQLEICLCLFGLASYKGECVLVARCFRDTMVVRENE